MEAWRHGSARRGARKKTGSCRELRRHSRAADGTGSGGIHVGGRQSGGRAHTPQRQGSLTQTAWQKLITVGGQSMIQARFSRAARSRLDHVPRKPLLPLVSPGCRTCTVPSLMAARHRVSRGGVMISRERRARVMGGGARKRGGGGEERVKTRLLCCLGFGCAPWLRHRCAPCAGHRPCTQQALQALQALEGTSSPLAHTTPGTRGPRRLLLDHRWSTRAAASAALLPVATAAAMVGRLRAPRRCRRLQLRRRRQSTCARSPASVRRPPSASSCSIASSTGSCL